VLAPHQPFPKIAAYTGGNRPRFSVMLPTHEPGEKLRMTLQSVLEQAPARHAMQIAVVDDGSRRSDVRSLVAAVDNTGRVEIHADGPRLGISGNWNRCIELARGHLVHLLHQDDLVLPGFYGRMEQAFMKVPQIGMAFCRSLLVDGDGRRLKTNSRLRWWRGLLPHCLRTFAIRQRVQTPSAVVPRTTYETLGGYRNDLCQTLDWEMWVRIAARFPVWYDPRVLAVFRRHSGSESSRLLSQGEVWPDLVRAMHVNAISFPDDHRESLVNGGAQWYAGSALREAKRQLLRGHHEAAKHTLTHAHELIKLVTDSGRQSALVKRAGLLDHQCRAMHDAASRVAEPTPAAALRRAS
jgi:glycosyltransferase involved in cell wall biosynthesis